MGLVTVPGEAVDLVDVPFQAEADDHEEKWEGNATEQPRGEDAADGHVALVKEGRQNGQQAVDSDHQLPEHAQSGEQVEEGSDPEAEVVSNQDEEPDAEIRRQDFEWEEDRCQNDTAQRYAPHQHVMRPLQAREPDSDGEGVGVCGDGDEGEEKAEGGPRDDPNLEVNLAQNRVIDIHFCVLRAAEPSLREIRFEGGSLLQLAAQRVTTETKGLTRELHHSLPRKRLGFASS